MKPFLICIILLSMLCGNLQSQSLILKGRIKCIVQGPNSSKGAENVVVVPNFIPPKATLTASRPSGYFEINTGIPLSKLEDKTITVYVLSRCTDCIETARRIFITEDRDRLNKNDDNSYCTVKDWMLNANCQKAEFKPIKADSVLRQVFKQPQQDLDHVSDASALVGAPAFLNFISAVASVAAPIGGGTLMAYQLPPGKISYGKFLLSSLLSHSMNTGFNFTPYRDLSEVVFWNPSAMSNSRNPINISLLTNLKNNVKLSGFFRFGKKLSLGGGIIYTKQDEFRQTVFIDPNDLSTFTVDSAQMNLKEYAGFISSAYKIDNKLSIGFTIKSIWQDFNIPNKLIGVNGVFEFQDSSINKQHFDVDLSATYKLNNDLQLGLNLMNMAGSKLFGDAFVPDEKNKSYINQRAIGFGIMYKFRRIHVGFDLLLANDKLYDATFGLNYVPFNNALISTGIAVKQLSYSFAFRIKHFRIAYIHDNDFLVNEKRKGTSKIFNGNIYGGFVFDLNR